MNWIKRFHRINEVAGVTIELRSAGAVIINACVLEAVSSKLTIQQKLIDVENPDALKNALVKPTSIALNISGKGVLHKQLERTDISTQDAFTQVMPNANAADFYIQRLSFTTTTFLSFIRRSEADKWLAVFANAGLNVLALSFGPFPVYHLQSDMNFYDEEMLFGGNLIKRDKDGQWQLFKVQEGLMATFPVRIANETIDERLIIPYAAAFQLILAEQLDQIVAQSEQINASLNSALEKNRLKASGIMVLGAFFLLLLVNFVALSLFDVANNKLSRQVTVSSQNIADAQLLQDELIKKRALVKGLGWDGGIRKTVFLNEIASLSPNEIIWSRVEVNPLDITRFHNQDASVFNDRHIKISGFSNRVIPINEWMARLRTRHWIKDVQLEDFSWNSELNTGQFTLLIAY